MKYQSSSPLMLLKNLPEEHIDYISLKHNYIYICICWERAKSHIAVLKKMIHPQLTLMVSHKLYHKTGMVKSTPNGYSLMKFWKIKIFYSRIYTYTVKVNPVGMVISSLQTLNLLPSKTLILLIKSTLPLLR